MKIMTNNISFNSSNDYLDVEIHHPEKWIELKIETTNGFPINNRRELDMIYHKLCEVFDEFEKEI